MKNKTYIFITKLFKTVFLALIIIISGMGTSILAQTDNDSLPAKAEKMSPALSLSSIKNSDETRSLVAILSYKNKETNKTFEIKDATIKFFVGTDSTINLGTIKTDENGKAVCHMNSNFIFPKNEEAIIHFSAEFEGNDFIESASNEVDIKDVIITMTLSEVDSVKTVSVKVEQINAKNEKVPLNEVELPILVARMFSNLKIGTITLAEGEGTIEFPKDLPGDTTGNVVVLAKFDENEEFGTVIKSDTIAWGIKTNHFNAYSPRSLWSTVAPVWMIVTLSIMLLGVWSHYVYVIIQLVKLKRKNPEILAS